MPHKIEINGEKYEMTEPLDTCQQCAFQHDELLCGLVQCANTSDPDAPEEEQTNWVFKKI